jgi:hypothetical protein
MLTTVITPEMRVKMPRHHHQRREHFADVDAVGDELRQAVARQALADAGEPVGAHELRHAVQQQQHPQRQPQDELADIVGEQLHGSSPFSGSCEYFSIKASILTAMRGASSAVRCNSRPKRARIGPGPAAELCYRSAP